ncbi:hypothetical protein VP01_1295g3 [Puccinia sorghi]|uniref:Uncharacterized protein n=1 Tax=Puccinia sorghi TaxID=27349 RepID=A0A0L6VPZ9_9BASI|nr:hypothetical protein VP01_1295g3 [Puccinia sorghi]
MGMGSFLGLFVRGGVRLSVFRWVLFACWAQIMRVLSYSIFIFFSGIEMMFRGNGCKDRERTVTGMWCVKDRIGRCRASKFGIATQYGNIAGVILSHSISFFFQKNLCCFGLIQELEEKCHNFRLKRMLKPLKPCLNVQIWMSSTHLGFLEGVGIQRRGLLIIFRVLDMNRPIVLQEQGSWLQRKLTPFLLRAQSSPISKSPQPNACVFDNEMPRDKPRSRFSARSAAAIIRENKLILKKRYNVACLLNLAGWHRKANDSRPGRVSYLTELLLPLPEDLFIDFFRINKLDWRSVANVYVLAISAVHVCEPPLVECNRSRKFEQDRPASGQKARCCVIYLGVAPLAGGCIFIKTPSPLFMNHINCALSEWENRGIQLIKTFNTILQLAICMLAREAGKFPHKLAPHELGMESDTGIEQMEGSIAPIRPTIGPPNLQLSHHQYHRKTFFHRTISQNIFSNFRICFPTRRSCKALITTMSLFPYKLKSAQKTTKCSHAPRILAPANWSISQAQPNRVSLAGTVLFGEFETSGCCCHNHCAFVVLKTELASSNTKPENEANGGTIGKPQSGCSTKDYVFRNTSCSHCQVQWDLIRKSSHHKLAICSVQSCHVVFLSPRALACTTSDERTTDHISISHVNFHSTNFHHQFCITLVRAGPKILSCGCESIKIEERG